MWDAINVWYTVESTVVSAGIKMFLAAVPRVYECTHLKADSVKPVSRQTFSASDPRFYDSTHLLLWFDSSTYLCGFDCMLETWRTISVWCSEVAKPRSQFTRSRCKLRGKPAYWCTMNAKNAIKYPLININDSNRTGIRFMCNENVRFPKSALCSTCVFPSIIFGQWSSG